LQEFNRLRQERLRRCHTLTEQILLLRHQSIAAALDLEPVAQSNFIGDSNEMLAIIIPIELNSKGLQRLVPSAVMQRFGVGQYAVEVKQERVKPGIRGSYQAIIIPCSKPRRRSGITAS
jgi:hypothetical protein